MEELALKVVAPLVVLNLLLGKKGVLALQVLATVQRVEVFKGQLVLAAFFIFL